MVENAPLGIQAAKAANTYCIAICSTLKSSFLQEADAIVDSFDQLRNLDIIDAFLIDAFLIDAFLRTSSNKFAGLPSEIQY